MPVRNLSMTDGLCFTITGVNGRDTFSYRLCTAKTTARMRLSYMAANEQLHDADLNYIVVR